MGLLDKFFPKPRSAPSQPPPQKAPQPYSTGSKTFPYGQQKTAGKNPSQGSNPSAQKPSSIFQDRYYVPPNEFILWLNKRVPSESQRKRLEEAIRKYWSFSNSFTRESFESLKYNLRIAADPSLRSPEEAKIARDLLDALQKFEKGE